MEFTGYKICRSSALRIEMSTEFIRIRINGHEDPLLTGASLKYKLFGLYQYVLV